MKFINLIFSFILAFLSLILPKKRGTQVFGEWFGQSASRETWHYFSACQSPKIWITRNNSVLSDLKSKGFLAYHAYSPKGLWTQLRAETAIVNVSSSDMARGAITGAKHYINLGHGIPMKTFLLSEHTSAWRLAKMKFRMSIFERYSVVWCPFKEFSRLYEKSYNVSGDHIFIDPNALSKKIRDNIPINGHYEYIIMLTHLAEGKTFDSSLYLSILEKINHNKSVLISLHPYEFKYLDSLRNETEKFKAKFKSLVVTVEHGIEFSGKNSIFITDASGSMYEFLANDIRCVIVFNSRLQDQGRELVFPPDYLPVTRTIAEELDKVLN